MSVKYTLIKGVFHVVPMQKMMAMPYEKLMEKFKTKQAVPNIPKLSDQALDFSVSKVSGCPVLEVSHKKPQNALCIYVVGGGMLKYPKPSQAKSMVALAKETGRDVWLPYFPLCPDYHLFDALEMLYETYKAALKRYEPEQIAFFSGSSGAYMTLCLMTLINQKAENLPMPGKLMLSSPGSALLPEERRHAEALNKTDLIMSTAALDNIFAGMAGGKELPEPFYYMQKGIYTGVKDVFLSYGGDEVFSAAAESTAKRLRSFGANVTLEVAAGMYHTYAAMPLVPEAQPGYERAIAYLRV